MVPEQEGSYRHEKHYPSWSVICLARVIISVRCVPLAIVGGGGGGGGAAAAAGQ